MLEGGPRKVRRLFGDMVIWMKAAFFTLGCKTNQFETQALSRLFAERGFEVVPFEEKADVYVVNTCSVTALADRKSRTAIRRAKALSPDAAIVVCGCYSEHESPDALLKCGAGLIFGSADKSRIPELAERFLKDRAAPELPPPSKEFDLLPAGRPDGRTRALLKVQDGCRNFCTYCIIPYVRGELKSLPLDLAVTESARLQKEGCREIVLTGIEISSYGVDLPGKPELSDLVKAVCAAAPAVRIRLGSLEPRTVTREFAEDLSKLPNLCPHFHLSLQSGCDRTLKAMGRRYDTARFNESCALLREYFPDCALTTDLIVGFPGETEEDFSETLSFLDKIGFAQVHVFPYSRREGTRAAKYEGQLTAGQKEERAASAAQIAAKTRRRYLETLFGKTLSVLFEQEEDGYFSGHSGQYIPVYVKGEGLRNSLLPVKITGALLDGLTGDLA